MAGSENTPIKYGDWTPGDIKIFDVDNQKLLNLGFQFRDFNEGLEETYAWFQAQQR
jgi:nucleoside-diphosphate-sugar epimerase